MEQTVLDRGELMAELAANANVEAHSHPRFFLWAALSCLLLAFGGFSHTYFAPMAAGTLRELSFAVHVHGFLFFGWTILFVLQVALIAKDRKSTHRSLGLMGISWATAMVIFGVLVSLLSNAKRFDSGCNRFRVRGPPEWYRRNDRLRSNVCAGHTQRSTPRLP